MPLLLLLVGNCVIKGLLLGFFYRLCINFEEVGKVSSAAVKLWWSCKSWDVNLFFFKSPNMGRFFLLRSKGLWVAVAARLCWSVAAVSEAQRGEMLQGPMCSFYSGLIVCEESESPPCWIGPDLWAYCWGKAMGYPKKLKVRVSLSDYYVFPLYFSMTLVIRKLNVQWWIEISATWHFPNSEHVFIGNQFQIRQGGEDREEQRSAFPAGPGRLRNTLQTEHSILKVAESTRCPVQNKKHSSVPEVSLLLKTHLPSNSVQRTQAQVFKIQGSNEAEVEITHLLCVSC